MTHKTMNISSRLDTGQSSYLIPVGGSSVVGLLGYLAGFQEMLDQGILDHVTDIVFACGSGGTAEGLALANYLAADCKLGFGVFYSFSFPLSLFFSVKA